MRLLQAFFNLFFGGFGFPGILTISPGDVAFFSVIIIGRSRDLLRVISGFPGERGSGYFIIPFGVMVFLGIIFRWLVGCSVPLYVAAFRWAVLLRVILPFFVFLFVLERSLSIYGPLESLSACFRKAPINLIHSGLDIAV